MKSLAESLIVPLFGDKAFEPIELFFEAYERDTEKSEKKEPFWVALERENGLTAVHKMNILPSDERTYAYVERTVKTLLWIKGGIKLFASGNAEICACLANDYKKGGAREFDAALMERVYGEQFSVTRVSFEEFPKERELPLQMGGNSNGCRIGFDAGGSDRKASAVKDGEVLFGEEVVWHPKTHENPDYHYAGIVSALKKAASYLPRVDSIGVSSAGIYVQNKTRVASLFIKVAPEDFKNKVENIYLNAAKEIGCDNIVVANDGDVAALAGANEVGSGELLGIAMGTSEAAGYVNAEKCLMGWLNELAFVPVDMSAHAMLDEWSGDIGCGVKYFSQDGVIKLMQNAGLSLPEDVSPGEKLKFIQKALAETPEKIAPVFESVGVYLAYTIKYYARFYNLKYVMLMGRVMSGKSGEIILGTARETLARVFPSLRVSLVLPDEKSRRLGQAATAALMPIVKRESKTADLKFSRSNSLLYVPDKTDACAALAKTTDLCIAAHQDDIEIMAYSAISACYRSKRRRFAGVVCADGAGSPRTGVYEDFTDEQMMAVRVLEQKHAADIGDYQSLALLGFSSGEIKDGKNKRIIEDLKDILMRSMPEVVYTHNLADKHDTHVSVALRVIEAIRALPVSARPKKLFGMEVWRGLDWLLDKDKTPFDTSERPGVAAALLGVFDSQVTGGKRYDLAALARRCANATFFESHFTDNTTSISFGLDLTPLIEKDDICPKEFISGFIRSFENDVADKIDRFKGI